ncbi:MAG: preprotein translocase subunit SecY [bacterium]|nr:preprotein translocase subunit SecY [bacterium]
MKGLEGILNPFKVYELRKRILFTLGLLAVYRLGVAVPTPGVDGVALSAFFQQAKGTIVGLLDLFSGGAFERFSIFTLGIMPYISASIIMSLLQPVVPYLERLAKEGEVGKKKITQYTRYLTLVIGIIQATGTSIWIQSMQTDDGRGFVLNPGLGFHLMTVATLTTGTAFVMWLGEQITDRGIGNGSSLIIMVSIISRLPQAIIQSLQRLFVGEMNIFVILFILIIGVLATAGVVIMIQGHRKISVQYAKRIVGRKVYGGQSTHLPLQVNMAGVIPIIFASSLLALPATFVTFLGGKDIDFLTFLYNQLNPGGVIYQILMASGIIFFTYFYIAVIFNPVDVADNMRKQGGFIPGIRPGKSTAEYIERILKRITFVGAIFLALIDFLPSMVIQAMHLPFYFGGTSILIVVGVALDTVRQIESHLLMRHYEGFVKKGKIRGRF